MFSEELYSLEKSYIAHDWHATGFEHPIVFSLLSHPIPTHSLSMLGPKKSTIIWSWNFSESFNSVCRHINGAFLTALGSQNEMQIVNMLCVVFIGSRLTYFSFAEESFTSGWCSKWFQYILTLVAQVVAFLLPCWRVYHGILTTHCNKVLV